MIINAEGVFVAPWSLGERGKRAKFSGWWIPPPRVPFLKLFSSRHPSGRERARPPEPEEAAEEAAEAAAEAESRGAAAGLADPLAASEPMQDTSAAVPLRREDV